MKGSARLLNQTIALATVAVGLVLAPQLDSPHHRLAFAIFFAGMAIAAWCGGIGPALVALALATSSTAMRVAHPTMTMAAPGATAFVGPAMFVLAALLIAVLTEARSRMARALRHTEARRDAILEASLDCIITIDDRGRIVEFNPAAETTFGYRRETVVGKDLADLIIPPAMRNAHRAGLARYLATGQGAAIGRRVEMTAIRADGCEFPAELAIVRIASDGPPLFTGYLRDLTERKQAEDLYKLAMAGELEASRAEARRNALFLNAISHDLRTPFNGLILQAKVMHMSLETGDHHALREALAQVDATTAAVGDLLDAFFEIAEDAPGASSLQLSDFRLEDQLCQVLRTCQASAEQKGLYLRGQAPEQLTLRTDRIKLERILLNLIENAVKFTSIGGVKVEIAVSGADLSISVVDTGIGIAAAERHHLFADFFQVHNQERERSNGFGLGLAVASRLTRQLGGDLTVESQLRRGSRFTLTLPGVVCNLRKELDVYNELTSCVNS